MTDVSITDSLSVMDAKIGGFIPHPANMLSNKLRISKLKGEPCISSSFNTWHQVASVSSSRYATRQAVDCCSLHQSTMRYAGEHDSAANRRTNNVDTNSNHAVIRAITAWLRERRCNNTDSDETRWTAPPNRRIFFFGGERAMSVYNPRETTNCHQNRTTADSHANHRKILRYEFFALKNDYYYYYCYHRDNNTHNVCVQETLAVITVITASLADTFVEVGV